MFWKFFVPIGLMAWACFYATVAMVGPQQRETEKLREEAKDYVQKSLPIILSKFDYAEWEVRATTELRQSVSTARMKADFARYRRIFGPLRKIEKPIGDVFVDEVRGVKIPTGSFLLRIQFRYGFVYAGVKVVKRGGGWKYQRFTLRSERAETIR
jgi:hypothetical protein